MRFSVKKVAFLLLVLCSLVLGTSVYFVLQNGSDAEDTDRTKRSDSGLFAIQECMRGCWQGLRPGEGSINEFIDFIHTESTAKIVSEDELHFPNGYAVYSFMLRDRDNQYELDGLGQEQSLRSISSQGSFDLTVIEIINQLGQPSYVQLGYGDDMYNGLFTRVSLFYPSDGYVFNIRPQIDRISSDKVRICIQEDDSLYGFEVFRPDSIQTILELESSVDLLPIDATVVEQRVRDLEPWPGLTCLERPYHV